VLKRLLGGGEVTVSLRGLQQRRPEQIVCQVLEGNTEASTDSYNKWLHGEL
jgi:hypothetical protein